MSRRSILLLASIGAVAAVLTAGLALHRSTNRDRELLARLQLEYDNGGLFQYFWNTRGEDNAATLAALQRTGHDRHAAVFAEAIQVFEAERSMLESVWSELDVSAYSEAVERSAIPTLDAQWGALPPLVPFDP